jgi:hypothetical protein
MSNGRISIRQRASVIERAEERCEYCLCPMRYSSSPFSVEHILPRAMGGTNSLTNLALSCQGCNNAKYTKIEGTDPATGLTVPLYHPRRQRWSDHFAWNEDYSEVVGLTPTGRATAATLELNREGLVNLRRVLILAGIHPPIDRRVKR